MATVRVFTTDRGEVSAVRPLAFGVEIIEVDDFSRPPDVGFYDLDGFPPNPTEFAPQLEPMIHELRGEPPTSRVAITVFDAALLASPEVQEVAEIAIASGVGADIFVVPPGD